jgi:RHS repeat-associated protein
MSGSYPAKSADATEQHFTGKERDTESGNDYFGARYYASSMGRFLSPDWSAKVQPVPYAKLDNPQSLNLYSYVLNNPLRAVDPDGHDMNVQNPCNGVKNCTSSVTTTSMTATANKDGSTTVTTQQNVVANLKNADGTSTRVSSTVTTSVTTESQQNGGGTTATQSQSAALVENFNKQGGSSAYFIPSSGEHSVALGTAYTDIGVGLGFKGNQAAGVGFLATRMGTDESNIQRLAENQDKMNHNPASEFKDRVDILDRAIDLAKSLSGSE